MCTHHLLTIMQSFVGLGDLLYQELENIKTLLEKL